LSRAFVKEQDGAEVDTDLPELIVSPHRNLATPEGLAHIDDRLHRAREAVVEARAAGDRAGIARYSRDLRYWEQRRASAEVVPHAAVSGIVRFGSRVVLRPEHGAALVFRIVGEDEASPADGRVSYVSPLAQAMIGGRVGDSIEFGDGEAEIVEIG
jgi:transcription elongation GreA/GreB family factor